MPTLLLRFSAALLFCVLSNVALADNCYVIGDTSNNNLSKPVGSKQNPYGSLATVEADTSCDRITVSHSGVVLDGGISLRDGQILVGSGADPTADPNADPASGAYATIKNSTGVKTDGDAVRCLGRCTVRKIWITEAWRSGINAVESNGDLTVQKSRVEKFNLGKVVRRTRVFEFGSTSTLAVPFAGILHSTTEGVAKTRIRDSVIAGTPTGSDSCGFGIQILSLGDSHLTSKISNVTVANLEGCTDFDVPVMGAFPLAKGVELIARNSSTHKATIKDSIIKDILGTPIPALATGISAESQSEKDDPGSALMDVKVVDSEVNNGGQLGMFLATRDTFGGGGSSRLKTEIIGNNITNTTPDGVLRFGILTQILNDGTSAAEEHHTIKYIGNTVATSGRVIQAAYNGNGTFETQILNNHATQTANPLAPAAAGLDAISVTTLFGVVTSELTTISGNDVVIEFDTQGSLGGIAVGPLSSASSGSVFSGLIDVTGNRVTINSSNIPGLINVTPGLSVFSNVAFDEIAVKDFDVLFADNCVMGNAPTPEGQDAVTGFILASVVGGAFPAPSAANPVPIAISLVNNSFINTDFDIFYGEPEALFVPMPAINFEVVAQGNFWDGPVDVGCVNSIDPSGMAVCDPATIFPDVSNPLGQDNACYGCFGPSCLDGSDDD